MKIVLFWVVFAAISLLIGLLTDEVETLSMSAYVGVINANVWLAAAWLKK